AIGFALIIAPGLLDLINRINTEKMSFKIFRIITVIILASTIIFSLLQKGKTSRNSDLLNDVYLIGKIIPGHSTISVDKSMWKEWDLQCYLVRHFNISVDPSDNYRNFYLLEKTLDKLPGDKYENIALKTKRYNLYKSNKNLKR
ncbi:MAG: hypothetical protein KJ607_09985, partial [Bacteroidetes bacterium]|nr:hypothetical protein [Bacteroidota bacterium]